MLCCVVLCCVVLCCAVLCCAVLCCAVLFCSDFIFSMTVSTAHKRNGERTRACLITHTNQGHPIQKHAGIAHADTAAMSMMNLSLAIGDGVGGLAQEGVTVWCGVLCCGMLCCVVLCCVVLCCVALCCCVSSTFQCCVILHSCDAFLP